MLAVAPLPRLRPVPIVEPRGVTDGQGGDRAGRRGMPGPGQGVLPLPPQLPGATGQETRPAARGDGPQAAAAQVWARHFTQVALEVVGGLRPPGQLVRWTSDEVQAALRRRHALARRRVLSPARATVRSVHVAHPVPGVAEVAAVVADGARHRAMAFRMEGAAGRWRVTALELG